MVGTIANLKITLELGNGTVSEIANIRLTLDDDKLTVQEAPAAVEVETLAVEMAPGAEAFPEVEVSTETEDEAEISEVEIPVVSKRRKSHPHSCGVVIDGVRYASYSAAARAYKVTGTTIKYRVEHEAPGYRKAAHSTKPIPVIVHGIRYPSKVEAGRANGVDGVTIANRIKARTPGYAKA